MTRTALACPPHQFEALLAHELGHHLGGHSKVGILTAWYQKPAAIAANHVPVIGRVIALSFYANASIGRQSELKADLSAARLGYGPALLQLFNGWQAEGHDDAQKNLKLLERVASSHPPVHKRIRNLETFEAGPTQAPLPAATAPTWTPSVPAPAPVVAPAPAAAAARAVFASSPSASGPPASPAAAVAGDGVQPVPSGTTGTADHQACYAIGGLWDPATVESFSAALRLAGVDGRIEDNSLVVPASAVGSVEALVAQFGLPIPDRRIR